MAVLGLMWAVTLTTLLSLSMLLQPLHRHFFDELSPQGERRKYLSINNSHPLLHFLWQPPNFTAEAQKLSKKLL